MEDKGLFARWRANFVTGLAVVLPAVISIAVIVWLFGSLANITDTLLFFLKYILNPAYIYQNGKSAPMFWYWSLFAFVLAIILISVIGRLARNYFGRKLIMWVDAGLLRIPLLNKIYGTIKQVNEAFSTGKKSAFKTVVLIQFPREGIYSLGFITSEQNSEVQAKTRENVVCVFVPEAQVTKLEMSVADAIKFVISLGSVTPEYTAPGTPELPPISQPRAGKMPPP